jgi:hypothetical protein
MTKPEVWRQHASLTAGFGRRQHQYPEHRHGGQRIDARGLPVRRDHGFELAPELIHRVQLGSLFRQPHEANAELLGQCLRLAIAC